MSKYEVLIGTASSVTKEADWIEVHDGALIGYSARDWRPGRPMPEQDTILWAIPHGHWSGVFEHEDGEELLG